MKRDFGYGFERIQLGFVLIVGENLFQRFTEYPCDAESQF